MQIDSKDGIFGIVEAEGWETVDNEISVWIQMGEFDYVVRERAKKVYPREDTIRQQWHRVLHPNGPWGWEYCAECMTDAL